MCSGLGVNRSVSWRKADRAAKKVLTGTLPGKIPNELIWYCDRLARLQGPISPKQLKYAESSSNVGLGHLGLSSSKVAKLGERVTFYLLLGYFFRTPRNLLLSYF